jgi:hypothetical protein
MDQIRMRGAQMMVVMTMNLVLVHHDGLGLATVNMAMEEIRVGMTAVQT